MCPKHHSATHNGTILLLLSEKVDMFHLYDTLYTIISFILLFVQNPRLNLNLPYNKSIIQHKAYVMEDGYLFRVLCIISYHPYITIGLDEMITNPHTYSTLVIASAECRRWRNEVIIMCPVSWGKLLHNGKGSLGLPCTQSPSMP